VWETDGDGTCRPVPGSLLSHCRENNIPLGLLSLLLPPWEVLCLSKGTQRPLQGSSNFPDLAQLEWAVATHCRGGGQGWGPCPATPSQHCWRHGLHGKLGSPGTSSYYWSMNRPV
jgi:hypothetical protein